MRTVTEADFRNPEFRDAKPEDYEFRPDGVLVRKDRWETALRSIATELGFVARAGFEVQEVVAAVDDLMEDGRKSQERIDRIAMALDIEGSTDDEVVETVTALPLNLADLQQRNRDKDLVIQQLQRSLEEAQRDRDFTLQRLQEVRADTDLPFPRDEWNKMRELFSISQGTEFTPAQMVEACYSLDADYNKTRESCRSYEVVIEGLQSQVNNALRQISSLEEQRDSLRTTVNEKDRELALLRTAHLSVNAKLSDAMNAIAKRDEELALLRGKVAQQVQITKAAREQYIAALTSGQMYVPPMPKTRAEFAAKVNDLMKNGATTAKSAWHFGSVELRELADWIYGTQLPLTEEEMIK